MTKPTKKTKSPKPRDPRRPYYILRRAYKLLKAGWVQDSYAEDANGEPVSIADPASCKFCLGGAIWRAQRDMGYSAEDSEAARRRLRAHIAGISIILFNDAKTTTKVLNAVRRAMQGGRAK